MPFFAASIPDTVTPVVYLGGSITNGASASVLESTSWRALTRKRLSQVQTTRRLTHYNEMMGGTPSWVRLFDLSDTIGYAPGLVFVEYTVNDVDHVILGGDRSDGFIPAFEALLRNLLNNISARYIFPTLNWPDNYSYMTANRRTARDADIAILEHYGFTSIHWDDYLVSLIGKGESYDDADVETYFAGVNNVHPNDVGHDTIYDYLVSLGMLSGFGEAPPAVLPARLYAESEDYEQTPIIRTGTDNDGETGTGWSTDGTARLSATADDTIAWSGTFCSFGLDTNYSTGAGTLAWDVDGGGYTNIDLSAKDVPNAPIWNFARGVHTVTIKVISGTVQINRFLAV